VKLGLHHMVITVSGCAGRLGSLVTDADIEATPCSVSEVCAHLAGGTCGDCAARCPVGALDGAGGLDKELCWARCSAVAGRFADLGVAEVCGKCAVGRCGLEAP
jgi:epoxyqueuosine reductase